MGRAYSHHATGYTGVKGGKKIAKYNKNPEALSSLSPEQYQVTQRDGTERAFENAYWDNTEPGLYVDVVSGEPLFASVDKFDSSSAWPNFTKAIEPEFEPGEQE